MKNSQKIILGVMAVALVVLGVFAYATLIGQNNANNDSGNEQEDNTTNNTDQVISPVVPDNTPEIVSLRVGLDELLSQPQNYECDFSSFQNSSNNNGKVYVSGGLIRSNYTAANSTDTQEVSMIRSNTVTYVWSGTEGFKFLNEDLENDTIFNQETTIDTLDSEKEVNYSCQEWVVDKAVFDLPTDVNFIEIQNTTEQVLNELEKIKTEECNKLEDPTNRQTCLESI